MYAMEKTCSADRLVLVAALVFLTGCVAESVTTAAPSAESAASGAVISDVPPGAEDPKPSVEPVVEAAAAVAAEEDSASADVAIVVDESRPLSLESGAGLVAPLLSEAPEAGVASEAGGDVVDGAANTETGATEASAVAESGSEGVGEVAADVSTTPNASSAAAVGVPIEGESGEPGQLSAGQVKKAIDSYVVKRTVEGGGLFEVVDDETGEALKLEFIGVRDPVRFIEGSGYFASVEFRPTDDTVGKRYDLHFWVNVRAEKLVVTEMKVHKHPVKSGTTWSQQARYTMVGHDAVPD
ncbi:MAG: hypothetical protein CL928_09820 [Deltaproteobacteria bacterium]|mgnify:CR=1 FL=1|nr:hypothetical protein [Deltaproteobacteria bacterium]